MEETKWGIRILFKSGTNAVFYFNSQRTQQRRMAEIYEAFGLARKMDLTTTRGRVIIHLQDIDVVGYTNAYTDPRSNINRTATGRAFARNNR